MSAEAVVVALTVLSAAALVGGCAGTLRQFAHATDPQPRRVSLRARYRRGRHHHPRLTTRLAASVLDAVRELAAAWAVLKGETLW